ncbi:MAG TPA: hypothetical protein VJ276_07600 [Thermoanaerobaculia bacterium]|nr:hypothetical protein [Thermoanaerobaculia bacterium]
MRIVLVLIVASLVVAVALTIIGVADEHGPLHVLIRPAEWTLHALDAEHGPPEEALTGLAANVAFYAGIFIIAGTTVLVARARRGQFPK